MQPYRFGQRCQKACLNALAVVGWAMAGAAIGLSTGLLFGVVGGTLLALLRGEWRVLASAGIYLGLCGAAAGALVGGFGRLVEACDGCADAANELRPSGDPTTACTKPVSRRASPPADVLAARQRLWDGLLPGSPWGKSPSPN
jgi:hypothetical protein